MKNYKKGFASLVILIVIAIVAIGIGTVYYQNNKNKKNIAVDNTPDTITEDTSTGIEVKVSTRVSVEPPKVGVNPNISPQVDVSLVKVVMSVSVGTTEEGASVIEPADYSFKLSPFNQQLKVKELTIGGTKIRIEAVEAHEDDSNYSKNVCTADRTKCFKANDWMIVSVNGKNIELAREDIIEVQFQNKTVIYVSAIDVEGSTSSSGSDIIVKKK